MKDNSLPESKNLIANFLEKILVEDGLAKNTVSAYQNDLSLFLDFLASKKVSIIGVESQDIKDYFHQLYELQLKSSSLMRKISAIKNFYQFLLSENIISSSPVDNIERPKSELKLPKFLTEEEVLKLLNSINNDKSEFGIRLACLLEMLYASGLRVSELVSLPISATSSIKSSDSKDGDNLNYLIVKGKGGKERIAPLNVSAIKILKEYLILRQSQGHEKSKWLFVGKYRSNKNGKKIISKNPPIIDQHLTRQRLNQMLKELAIKAGVDPAKVHPHVIRHSFASHLLNRGIDLRVLQELLGHSDISTTQIYTHILDSKLKELVFKHHPLANK
jgi:integrase/recombinase XerD